MELIIRNTNNQPIYEQICTQIKAQIIAGKLAPGEALPSIRALAKDLRVSVITTKRAYDELEADGFLYTVAGKGCFVAEKNLDLIREQKLKELEDHLTAAVELGAGLLEATEVVEPNPIRPNGSTSYSNLYHCDRDGVYLYIDTVSGQLADAIRNSEAQT